ncbi:DUF397 domain-containing protein [Actinoplanes sp. NEAU-A12]|uniref:DUF397 domain-containing protein n=2 Tax=Actinoplanes sandaracinus TaxID=3045177 RepID=A0ABT6WEA9_9ACTN|nr:DUF397 domain-containing protein [Actinoplanes sandaracinus]
MIIETKGMTINLADAEWRKAGKSNATGHCVEVAFLENATVVRDSKNPSGQPLVFTGAEWDAFLDGAKKGEFERA